MEITLMGFKMRVEIIILCMIIGAFIGVNVFCSCAGGLKEGFEVSSNLVGSAIGYTMGEGVKSSWEKKTSTADYVKDLNQPMESNTGGQVPLPESELIMFNDNKFAPECCPSVYSNSSGCVCATPEQMNYLNQRGGNRTLTTEY
jgi:hypothetical protein